MRITKTLSFAAAAFAAVVGATTAQAATVITFDSSRNGQTTLPASYQPLMAASGNDGGALGIMINWGNIASSAKAFNGPVTDHTPGSNGSGYVGYDDGAFTNTITFDHAVTLPSLYFSNYFSGTDFTITFNGYTTIGDLIPAISITRTYDQATGYNWIQETGLAGHAITAFSFTGARYKQLDDITVVAVPEPATWAMMLAGFGMIGFVARRRKASVRVTYA